MIGELRPTVAKFAEAMEEKLRKNNYKGGWQHCTTVYLSRRCGNELDELRAVVGNLNKYRAKHQNYMARTPEQEEMVKTLARMILNEAADVANFAMMLADVCGGLP